MEPDLWIEIEDGDVFLGTLEQFKDCFFSNADEASIRDWCFENHYNLSMTRVEPADLLILKSVKSLSDSNLQKNDSQRGTDVQDRLLNWLLWNVDLDAVKHHFEDDPDVLNYIEWWETSD